MKRIFFVLLSLTVCLGVYAQESSKGNAYLFADLSVGAGNSITAGALSLNRMHPLINNRLHLGYGLRLNSLSGSGLRYITAPAKYTLADPPQIDSATVDRTSSLSLSAALQIGFELSPKILLGFNIDVIGVTFGSLQDIDIDYIYTAENSIINTTGKPTSANLLLVGDNDIGTLNSEFYARYGLTEHIKVRGGLSFFFSEYTTETSGSDSNNRFRHKAAFPFLALSYRL